MPKNAISLFYGVNLRCFVPIFSKKREKCAKKCPPGAPQSPLTPRNAFFCWGRVCSKWPMPKNAISLFYGVNQRCFAPIFSKKREKCAKKRPPGAPPLSLTPQNAFFCWGRMCTKWPMPKNAISLFYGVNLRCFVPIFSKKRKKCAKKRPPGAPPPPWPPKTYFSVGGGCVLSDQCQKTP